MSLLFHCYEKGKLPISKYFILFEFDEGGDDGEGSDEIYT